MTEEEKNEIKKNLRGIYSKASVERMIAVLVKTASIEVSISSELEDKHHRTTTGTALCAEEIENRQAHNSYLTSNKTAAQDAIKKMLKGEFGLCTECGKRIPEERMEACPEATKCVSCKAKKHRIPALAHR